MRLLAPTLALIAPVGAYQTVPRPARPRHPHAKLILPELTVVDPSYNLAAGSAVVGTLCGGLEDIKGPSGDKLPTAKLFGGAAVLFVVFAAFIAFQTSTLRFQFDSTNFALVKADGSTTGENVVVGGENSWRYDSFVNYDFLPSREFPILVYFRETQTPAADRQDAPIVVDDLVGQVHFFPAIANVQQLNDQFAVHKCTKL